MSDRPFWSHQTKFIELGDRLPSAGALMRPGSGKTRAMIEVLRKEYNRARGIRNTLIFAPPLPCHGWRREFAAYSKIPEDRIHVLTMQGKKRAEALRNCKKPAIIITNYEGVQIKEFYQELLKFSPEIVVLDESHRIKDAGSVRAKAIYPLCLGARRRFIMTGTLTPNSMLDVYGQFKAMNPSLLGPSFWQWRMKYFFDKNAGMPSHVHFPDWQPRPEAAEWLGKLIAEHCVQAGEAADLPPLQEIVLPVELGKDQRKAYDSMAKEFVAECKSTVAIAEFALTKTIRLRQILCGFLQESASVGIEPPKTVWFDDCPRLDAMKDLLDSLKGERVLIWTEFQPTYKKLGEIAEKQGFKVGFLTGEQSMKEKNEVREGFIRGDITAIIAHPAAAGEGVDGLQVSRYAIYFARGYNALHFEQSKARNHRGGGDKQRHVTHYHLSAEGTLDEVINNALLQKKKVSDLVLDWAKTLSIGK